MSTRTLTLDDAIAVVRLMRPEDRACVEALMPGISDDDFAANRCNTDGPAWSVIDDGGQPVAIGGVSFQNAWSGVFWFVATPAMKRKQWENTIRNLDTVITCLQDRNHPHFRQRLEAYTLDGWDAAARFASSRFAFEGVKRKAGSGGQDILMWARVAE